MKLLTAIVLCFTVWGVAEASLSSQEPLDCEDGTSDDMIGALTHIGNLLSTVRDDVDNVRKHFDYALDEDQKKLEEEFDDLIPIFENMTADPSAMTSNDTMNELNSITDRMRDTLDYIISPGTGDWYACHRSKGKDGQKFVDLLANLKTADSGEKDDAMKKLAKFLFKVAKYLSVALAAPTIRYRIHS